MDAIRALFLLTAALIVMTNGAGAHADAAWRATDVRVAQAAAETQQPADPDARAAGQDAVAFEERVARFVVNFYLAADGLSDEEIMKIYAPRVAYFDEQVRTREQIVVDKKAYFARWPKRTYRLERDTLKIARRGDGEKIYDVMFAYTFDLASGRRVSRGRGMTYLTLDLTGEGRITRETGSVLQRW